MEHIVQAGTGNIDFTAYLRYLETVREQLPAHVHAFASNPRHFDLTSHSSLHDAWLESLNLAEVGSGERAENRSLEIAITLLGPFHDRRIHLRYAGVTSYSCMVPPPEGAEGAGQGNGDLFTHEVRLGRDGLLVHEILFVRGTTIRIECADFRHSEEMLPE